MGDVEFHRCDVCKKESEVWRKYYRYDIKCNCCNGENDNHFEIVRYCKDCKPKPPKTLIVIMAPLGEGYIYTGERAVTGVTSPCLTVGKTYRIIDTRETPTWNQKTISIRDDKGVKRWYSPLFIERSFENKTI